jgi:2-methylcitrate dehydratase PrpD
VSEPASTAGGPGSAEGATRALARLAADTRWEELPAAVRHQACRGLVDLVGVALGGQAHPSVDALLAVVGGIGGRRQATVLGRGLRTAAPLAALVNAHAAHVDDLDDTLMAAETSLHGTAPVYGAALALGEWRRLPGPAVLAAFVVGFEAAARVALALSAEHYAAGWHVTGTAGRLGAAAAAGRLLGLAPGPLAAALGLAATQAAGLKAAYGTMAKAHHAGRAAHDGVWAALLAAQGFTGPADVLEARHGMLALYATRPRPERLDGEGPGRWHVLDDGFKPYPCGSLVHAAIDAAVEIATRHRPDAAAIADVEAVVNPHVVTTTGRLAPRTGLEAKFSAVHCIAAALVHGRGLRRSDFEDDAIADPRLGALRARVRLRPDPGMPKAGAALAVRLEDGRALRAEVAAARGTTGRPLSDADLGDKFLGLAEPVLGRRARRALDRLWAIERAPDVAPVLRSLGPARPAARAGPA